MMEILIVTGGIGSGKSEVCRILAGNGINAQYNADSKVKQLYSSVTGLVPAIEEKLGCTLRDEQGNFVPQLLAARIFSDREALEAVESLVFPELLADFRNFAEKAGESIVVFESATILDKPFFDGFGDKVILVDAPMQIRLERACARDASDRERILARMANQKAVNAISEGNSDQRIDAVVKNDGTIDDLERNVDEIMTGLFGDWKRDIV